MATSSGRDVLRRGSFGFLQHGALRELVKGFAQILQGAMDASSYGVELAAEQAGNFLVLQFLEAAEEQDLPLFLRQLLERALQQLDFLLFHGGIRWRNRREHFSRRSPPPRQLPQTSDTGGGRTLGKPGPQRRPRAADLAGI